MSNAANRVGAMLFFVFVMGSAFASRAWAGTAGRDVGITPSYIYTNSIVLAANVPYTIETEQLGAGVDTILHVQNADGTFLAGNDDCWSSGNPNCGPETWRSWVQISASSSVRNVMIVVRGYQYATDGQATLRITGQFSLSYPILVNKGFTHSWTSCQDRSLFTTTEAPTSDSTYEDSVMLLVCGGLGHATVFDDDDGAWLMSQGELPVGSACSPCYAIVGAYSSTAPMNLVWDEDLHTPGYDPDNDGLSTTLENILGTSPNNADSEADGIDDDEELYGLENQYLRFPKYGGQPYARDVYIEANWLNCTDVACPSHDFYQMTTQVATGLAGFYTPALVAVHVDNRVENGFDATVNNWAGAHRFDNWDPDPNHLCDQATSDRLGRFHFVRMFSGIGFSNVGACFAASNNANELAHESGHNFGLQHWATEGLQTTAIYRNCAPNYRSIMSYAFEGSNWGFSTYTFINQALNPTALNEVAGLHEPGGGVAVHLNQPPFNFYVNALTGAVDWNRDNKPGFDTNVRAAPNLVGQGTYECQFVEYFYHRDNEPAYPNRAGSALSWVHFPSGNRLYWFMRTTGNGLEYRYATATPDMCATQPPHTNPNCATNWTPSVFNNPASVPNSITAGTSPAAGHAVLNGTDKLVLAYVDTVSKLRWQWATASQWSTYSYIDANTVVTGDLAMISHNNEVYLYAISSANNQLLEWKLSTSGAWSGPVAQTLSGGAPVTAAFGIGAAKGTITNTFDFTKFVAAIPAPGTGVVDFAYKTPGTAVWTVLPVGNWSQRPVVGGQPGLAYEAFSPSNQAIGRFYLMYWDSQLHPHRAYLWTSEGNNITAGATYRRLRFFDATKVMWSTVYGTLKNNIALLFDPAFDQNLRSAQTADPGGEATFIPYADGIINGQIRDQDDVGHIQVNMACSLENPEYCW
jgi:hypothetical protein